MRVIKNIFKIINQESRDAKIYHINYDYASECNDFSIIMSGVSLADGFIIAGRIMEFLVQEIYITPEDHRTNVFTDNKGIVCIQIENLDEEEDLEEL